MARTAMTEDVWLGHRWDHVQPPRRIFVVEWLQEVSSPRKMRLFACACARVVLDFFPHLEHIIETAERVADELVDLSTLQHLRDEAYNALAASEMEHNATPEDEETPSLLAHRGLCGLTHDNIALSLIELLREPFPYREMLHEIFGNPFHQIALEQEWLEWERGLIRRMAEDIYERRAFDECPILADALEEAGCTETILLTHLHGPNPHARGCWGLDMLLGRA